MDSRIGLDGSGSWMEGASSDSAAAAAVAVARSRCAEPVGGASVGGCAAARTGTGCVETSSHRDMTTWGGAPSFLIKPADAVMATSAASALTVSPMGPLLLALLALLRVSSVPQSLYPLLLLCTRSRMLLPVLMYVAAVRLDSSGCSAGWVGASICGVAEPHHRLPALERVVASCPNACFALLMRKLIASTACCACSLPVMHQVGHTNSASLSDPIT